MRISATITALLAVTSAAASPFAVGDAVQVAERAEASSFGDLSSQLETIKSLVDKNFSGSETPSASEVTDITDRINALVTGLVPLKLESLTGGDLLSLLDVLDNLDGIIGSLTNTIPSGSLQSRQLSYAPIIDVLYPLLTSLSELVSGVLKTVYGAVGSSAAREDSEVLEKLLRGTSGLSKDTGSLFGLLGGLGNLGDLLPIGN